MPLFSRKKSDRPELPTGHDDSASPWYVAPELRDDYLAHTPTFHEVKKEVEKLIKERGKEVFAATLKSEGKKGNLTPEWARRSPSARSAAPGIPGPQEYAREHASAQRAAAEEGGEQEGDAELAEHRARLVFAKRCKSEREKAERAEKRRQDARCRSCDALDVPTAPAVFTLMPAPRPNHTPGHNNKAQTYTVGNGPVCGHCRVLVIAEERARIASQKVGDSTRGELVKRFLNRARG